MGETIEVRASLRIEAPPDVVRAQYRDIDHHMRGNVHPDIRFGWEPADPGQRKVRTAFRILGMPQFDVALLEEAPDGTFVIRYLEGTNAGMVVEHRFVPLDGGKATEVRISAKAPATLGRKLLGPLFVIGARQVIKKALAEDKRDIERGFQPGKAAGHVETALGILAGVRGRGDAPARAILEAACFVTAVDGTVDEAESDLVRRAAAQLAVDAGWIQDRQALLARDAVGDGATARARELGAQLRDRGVAQEGITAAAAAALVSTGLSIGELSALRAIAEGAEIPAERVGAIVEEVDLALGAG